LLTGLPKALQAQQIDVAIGGGSITAPPASAASGTHEAQSLTGGLYPSASADFLFFKRVGVQGEIAWRWRDSTYAPGYVNLPFKPIFYDFNAIWSSKTLNYRFVHLAVEALGGAGVATTRFYVQGCSGSSCYGTTNHFMVVGGGGIKFYVWRHFFIRPEARYYQIKNNVEFSSAHALRYSGSIGYTFR